MKKVIVYSYVKPVNKKYLETLSLKSNNAVSVCLDAVLDAARLKKKMSLKTKTLKTLARLEKAKNRKKNKIKMLTNLK